MTIGKEKEDEFIKKLPQSSSACALTKTSNFRQQKLFIPSGAAARLCDMVILSLFTSIIFQDHPLALV